MTVTLPATPPTGVRLVLDGGVRRDEGGRLLIGGSPLRLIRLSDAGSAVVDRWSNGETVGAGRGEVTLARRLLDAGMAHPEPEPDDGTAVTVVIPVRDDAARLDRCLAGCRGHAAVVVDDGSRDPTAVAAVAERQGARLVRRPSSGGPGVARGDGLASVDTPLVAFVDADVDPSPGWIPALAGHLRDPWVAAAAPRVRSRPGPSVIERYESVHSPLDLGGAPSPVGPGRPVPYVPTAALVARVSVLRELGGFDPELRLGEDVDLVWRLAAAGHTIRYDPRVEVVHEPRDTWSAWLAQRRGYGSSAAPLGRRHGDAVAPARCSPWSAAGWGAVAAGHPAVGATVMVGSTAALVRRLGDLDQPVGQAARLAGRGHLWAGVGLARAVTRAWWPLAVGAAAVRPRLRPALAAAVLAPAVLGWVTGERPLDPGRSVALRITDDLAYGVGVWEGMIRHRTTAPIVPDLGEWPGRRDAVERAGPSAG